MTTEESRCPSNTAEQNNENCIFFGIMLASVIWDRQHWRWHLAAIFPGTWCSDEIHRSALPELCICDPSIPKYTKAIQSWEAARSIMGATSANELAEICAGHPKFKESCWTLDPSWPVAHFRLPGVVLSGELSFYASMETGQLSALRCNDRPWPVTSRDFGWFWTWMGVFWFELYTELPGITAELCINGVAGTERSYTPLLTSRGTSGEHNSGVLKHFTEQVPSRQRTGIWPTSDDNDLVEHGRILHLFFTGRHVWLSRVNMTQCRKGMRTLLRLIMAGNQNTPIGGLFLERNILRKLLGWQYLSMLRRSSIWPEHEGSVPDIDFVHLRHLLKLLATRWERTISKHDC